MKKLLLLSVAALLAACGSKTSGPASNNSEPAAAATAAATPAAAAAKTNAGNAAQETANTEDSPGDASLERAATVPAAAKLPAGKWEAGKNYIPIVPAQSTSAEPGQVEVIEFMWLGCPHCADLQPTLEAWVSKKPAYIKFVQEHVMWGPAHRQHAKLLYTLQALNRSDLVGKAFEQIHQRNNSLLSSKGDEAETMAIQMAFAKSNGISEADFKREYNGFGVNTRLQRSEELNRRYRIESVPTIIINGKYNTDVSKAGDKEKLLQLINDLAAAEKGR